MTEKKIILKNSIVDVLILVYNEHMQKYFTTGQFAKLANVSVRTIRYYDKEGLLKPSFIMENGYRKYSEQDFIRLQRIISLKQLGFSLDEIKMMEQTNDRKTLDESLHMQIELLDKRIKHSQLLKDSLIQTRHMLNQDDKNFDWNKIVELIQMSTQEEKIIEHYRDARHLSIRIRLHDHYSVNPIGWFPWLYSQIDFSHVNRLLEVGCGSGELWKQQAIDVQNREIFLSDISDGMIENARSNLGEKFSYMVFDAAKIPFKQEYFDAVIANHMLFYLNDIEQGIEEIARVLKLHGILYCSTYGRSHMKEISDLVKGFDKRITLSDNVLSDIFGLEYGDEILRKYFRNIEKRMYEDELIVDDAQALYEYIMSCHGNQRELLSDHMDEFKQYIQEKIRKDGPIHITKEAGMFICHK